MLVHVLAVMSWLALARPLWHIGTEQRCPDFGDALNTNFLTIALIAGAGAAGFGLFYTVAKRAFQPRKASIAAWSLLVAIWMIAAAYAYWQIHRQIVTQC